MKKILALLVTFSVLVTLSSCAWNDIKITLNGDHNTVNTSSSTDKKSDTAVDAAGSGYGSIGK